MASQNARFRYQFEHVVLPDLFYNAPSTVMRDLASGGSSYIAFLWKTAMESQEEQDIPDAAQEQLIAYTEEDFHVQFGEKNGRNYCIIQMPKAAAELQCSRIGLVLSQDGTYQNYFTVERMATKEYALCGWSLSEGSLCHNNYCQFAKNERKIAEEMLRKMTSPEKR